MNTNKNIGYTFDFSTSTLTITADFAKKASQIGTKEYRIMKQLRADHPNLVIEKRTHKSSDKARTHIKFDEMKTYIGKCRNAEQYLKLFQIVRELSKGQPSSYHYVCNWFEKNFVHYAEPVLDADGFVVDGEALDKLRKQETIVQPDTVQTVVA